MGAREAGTREDGDAALREFTAEVFASLRRAEQRRWAQTYLRALALAPGRKTPLRLVRAAHLPPAAAKGLHQFVHASPWEWRPVRARLAGLVAGRTRPYAWTVADVVLPKTGAHTVGVHTRPDPADGRAVHGQRALGLFLAAPGASFPVDWHLVLDGPWAADRSLRARARVPRTELPRPAGLHILDLATGDPARTGPAGLPWVLDLTPYAEAGTVLAALARLGRAVVAEVPPDLELRHARPGTSTAGALLEPLLRRRPYPAVHAHPGPVRLPGFGPGGAYRLLGCAPPGGAGAARHWLTDLADAGAEQVLALLPARVRTAETLASLRAQYGLADFTGRSFPGWHHHMTLLSAAYAQARLPAGDPGTER
ncbi:transposase [Streptomyces sp. NPDC049813]|uniref:IS701 family transposase n=1 Tax=Streptomyces sp. NPDC049813 TaxID=3365597 RepID=UPI0037B2A673